MITNKTAAVVAHDGREGDTHNMSTPFDDTTDRQERPVIGRSIHPGYIDVPFAINEVLDHRGQQTIGDTLEVRTLDRDLLDQLEAEVAKYEKDAALWNIPSSSSPPPPTRRPTTPPWPTTNATSPSRSRACAARSNAAASSST